MRAKLLALPLCVALVALALPTVQAQEGGPPPIRVAPAVRWPTRAPFGTTIRCPFSYVPDYDTVNCWGSGAVSLVMLEGPKCVYCGYAGHYRVYYYYYYRRSGCFGGVERRAFLRVA